MASNSSSPQGSKDQEKKKGKNTAEYKKVKENMNDFIEAIESIGAVDKLHTMFVESEWLETNPNVISAKNLITQALNRIDNDSTQHVVFLQMLQKITGMDQMVKKLTVYAVTQSESNPTSSNSAIVSGKNDHASPDSVIRSVKNDPPMATKKYHHLEFDSGLPGDDPSTPDTMQMEVGDRFASIQSPRNSQPFKTSKSEGQIAVVCPILPSGASTTYTHSPVNKKTRLREQQDDSDAIGDPEDTDTPVPISGGSVNTEAQQPRLDVVPYPQNTTFTVGPPEDVGATIEGEQVPSSSLSNVAKQSVPVQIDEAKKYLSSNVINEIETLKKNNEKLNELSQELEILNDRYKQLQKSAKEKEEAAEKKLKEKEEELEKCKQKLAKAELEYEEKCTQLEKEIEKLKQEINDEKESNGKKILELKLQLSQKENIICVKEKEIAELEKKILEKENEEIREQLLREKKQSTEQLKEKEEKLLREKEKSTDNIKKLIKENEEMRERERNF